MLGPASERLGSGGAVSDRPLRFRGKTLGPQVLSQIRQVVRGRRGSTRQAISRRLCELFG